MYTEKEIEDMRDKYGSYLKDIDTDILLIVKGHLVIEECLNEIAEKLVLNKKALAEAKLSFAQLMQVTRALVPTSYPSSLWAVIASLNTLRNDVAHRIESKSRKEKIVKFVSLVIELDPEKSRLEGIDKRDLLEYSIGFVVGLLKALLAHCPENTSRVTSP